MANAKERLLEEVWLKAEREGKVRLSFGDKRVAAKVRFALYNVAREDRGASEEVKRARRNCTITWVGEKEIEVVKVEETEDMISIAAALGITAEELLEQQIRESEARLFGVLKKEEVDMSPEAQAVRAKAAKYLGKA